MLDNKKRNSSNSDTDGSPAWMTTFGDMMTLLLVFFVMLYSFSVMDLEKFQGFIDSFQNQIGILERGKTIMDEDLIARGSQGQDFNVARENLTMVQERLQNYIQREGLEDRVALQMSSRGLVVSVRGEVLYEIGRANILPEGRALLNEIINYIDDIPNEIRVEGHTDNWPIRTEEFPSNWELSTARATNVVRYFVNNTTINPYRFSAAGYSEYRPVAENNTSENRALNRRVEIVILNSIYNNNNNGR